jgi:antitoxin component of RelBE/YafQ-DinJ toxin-antitoxin module
MRRRARLLILLTVLLLILIPQVLGQFSITPTSLVYIHVEPQGLGEVGYYPSFSGPLREWPRVTTPIMSFFTMAFTQGTYLYLEARPYGCTELDRWEITPQDVNMTYVGSKERLIIILDRDYITVKAVFKKIPESSCPYIPVWGSIRFRKSDVFTFLTVTSMICSVGAVAYKVKKARDRRREIEEERRSRIERMRNKLLEDTKNTWTPHTWYPSPWHVILYTALMRPQLEECDIQELERALLDDNQLRYLRSCLGSWRSTIEQSYLSHIYIHRMALIGMKIYLALLGLTPSTDKIVEIFLESIDSSKDIPTSLWTHEDGAKIIRRMMNLIKSNRELHEMGLRNVHYLMSVNPLFRDRIRNPPEYYEAILAKVFEWVKEYLGIKFGGIRVRPEMGDDRRYWEEQERYEREKYRLWTISEPIEKTVEEEKTPKEERIEEKREEREGIKLPEYFEPPDWLVKALKERKEEEREEEEKIKKLEEEMEKKTEKPREAPKPEIPKIEVPVKWDELPRQLQIQIQDLGLTYEEVAYIALKTIGRDEREIYREANKLIMEKYPEMGEQDATSVLLILVDIISQLRNMFEDRGVKPQEPIERHLEIRAELEELKPTQEPAQPVEKPMLEAKEEVEAFGEAGKAEEQVMKPAGEEEVGGKVAPKPVEEEGEIPVERTADGKLIYDGVEVDRVGWLRFPFSVISPKTLYLIDSPASWIPTPLLVDLFNQSISYKPITIEGKKAHGRTSLLDELFNKVRETSMKGYVPVIIIGRPGYLERKGPSLAYFKTLTYIDRLRSLLKKLREAKIKNFAVVMPFKIYKQYCRDIIELQVMEKHAYIADMKRVFKELRGKVPETALPYLAVIASLSFELLDQLSKYLERKQITWEPPWGGWEYEKTEESRALTWAVKRILAKGGPLTFDEAKIAGYEDYIESLKVLGMFKE